MNEASHANARARLGLFLLIAVVVMATATRFLWLESIPGGVYIDEAGSATHALCLLETGRNAADAVPGMLSETMPTAFSTLPYLVGLSVYAAIAGHEIGDLRAFSSLAVALATLAAYLLGARLQSSRLGLAWALMMSVSPWLFAAARMAWDPPLVLPLMLFGCWFLLHPQLRLRHSLSGALLLVLAAWTYSPTRIQVVLLFGALCLFRYGRDWRAAASQQLPALLVLIGGATLLVIAIATTPGSLDRAARLSIFGDVLWRQLSKTPDAFDFTWAFGKIFALHFSPGFLLLNGDGNPRHSSGFGGVLGPLEVIGILAALICFRRADAVTRRIMLLACAGVVSGIVPSALTWESQPHALRSIGAAPWFALLAASGASAMWQWRSPWRSGVLIAGSMAGAVFFVAFLRDYFMEFPSRSAWAFEPEATAAAIELRQGGDLDAFIGKTQAGYRFPIAGFYLMRDGGLSCAEARVRYEH